MKRWAFSRPGSWLAFLMTATLTGVAIIDFCGWVFQCGCRSWWAGAASRCNIHLAHGHHCPWCTIGAAGFWGMVAGIVLLQFAVCFQAKPWGLVRRIGLSALVFFLSASFLAILGGITQAYWD